MLLDFLKTETVSLPYINTGTLFDLATGRFRPGVKNPWVLDGGISTCMGVTGRAQTYKSTMAGSFLARALAIHTDSEAYIYETENAVYGKERYCDFVDDPSIADRIVFNTATEFSLSDFYNQFVELVEKKLKAKKDYIIDSPFLDPKTKQPYKMWMPTFVLVDSFSRARANKSISQFEDNNIDDSSLTGAFLADGNFKTRIMTDLPQRASKAGIYVILTAHVGNQPQLDPYHPNPKQLQYLKANEKMKSVGSNFEYLTSTLLQTLRTTVMQNSNKQCEYPNENSTPTEVNEIMTNMIRCKNNASGSQIPYVVSQYQGILNNVTNFNLLRQNGNYGLEVRGNNQGFKLPFGYDKELTKNNLRKATADPKVERALELIAQLCFIQTFWSHWKMPEYVTMRPEDLASKLKDSQKCSIDRVLNSTGAWSTAKTDKEYLSILDVLSILHNENPNTHKVVSLGK